MLFLRRIIKSLLLTALTGFVIRKLMASNDPRVSNVGHRANRLVGGFVGLDESGRRVTRRRRRAAGSAGSALVGGALSYFFDPQQGRDRRERAKGFARERLARRNGHHLLPAAGGTGTTGDAPHGVETHSPIT